MQDAGKSVFTADSEYVPLLLTFVSDHGNREVAMVWGAQRVFEDRQRPKGCAPHLFLTRGAASDDCYSSPLTPLLSFQEGCPGGQSASYSSSLQAHDHILSACRLLRRMLTDLHSLRIVSGQALETWRYKTGDTEAIKDVSSWLDELRNSDEGPE